MTDSIAVIIPDRRYTKVRNLDGEVAGRLETVRLAADGLPVTPRAFPAHSSPPRLAYTAVGNDDQPQFPEMGRRLSRNDWIGVFVSVAVGLDAVAAAVYGLWEITR
jgi:hypothetical protein